MKFARRIGRPARWPKPKLARGIYRAEIVGFLVRVTTGNRFGIGSTGYRRTPVIDEAWELVGFSLDEAIEWREDRLIEIAEAAKEIPPDPLNVAASLFSDLQANAAAVPSFVKTLGLEAWPRVTEAEVRRAYRQRSREVHPDKGGDHDSMIALTSAYDAAMRSLRGRRHG